MIKALEPFVLTFIPIFVAVDAIGNIPIFVAMAEGMTRKQKHRVVLESVATATSLAIIFMFAGRMVLRFIGITVPDFQVAGGILLFVISTQLLLAGGKTLHTASHSKDVGVFPLGTPLITGPAVLTTTLMMLDSFPWYYTFVSLLANMLVVWITLAKADTIINGIGVNGTRAFSKIMYILLAAIGVMMVRKGILGVLSL